MSREIDRVWGIGCEEKDGKKECSVVRLEENIDPMTTTFQATDGHKHVENVVVEDLDRVIGVNAGRSESPSPDDWPVSGGSDEAYVEGLTPTSDEKTVSELREGSCNIGERQGEKVMSCKWDE